MPAALAEPIIVASFWKNRRHDAVRVTLKQYEGREAVDRRREVARRLIVILVKRSLEAPPDFLCHARSGRLARIAEQRPQVVVEGNSHLPFCWSAGHQMPVCC